MKLSAPPPPPPEPNEPSPHAAGDAPPAPDAAAPAEPPAETPAAPKALAWPAWFPGADLLLLGLVLALAFLASSFVARNSDIWLHLAAGRQLLAGEYKPGTDPFSYSAADRTWVNHSILFDAVAYLLYGGNGMLLVVLKALAVVASFGLVLALRRPGRPLWPWAAVGLVAVLALIPYAQLRPYTASMPLFALTLYLLFRGNYRSGSWLFPAAIGATFWVWANVDEWFFLGPLAVALVLAGELVQGLFAAPAGESAGETLGSPPDVPALAKALGIGLVACMLNPHHYHIWQLPLELTGARELASADIRFRQVLLSPLDSLYYQQRELGYSLNGLAYAVLFVAGGAAVGLAGARLRFAHLLLWVVFALLSLQSIYAIPFLALLAVPLVASALNAASSRATLTTWGDPKSRMLLLGSGFGRVAMLIAAVVLCVLAWPGWVHPRSASEAYAKRVAWAIEPDEGMKRGAEQLRAWREGDHPRLSPEARGVILSVELANYCAWFAPREKVYANARYRHHLRELITYTELRKGLGLVEVPPERRPGPQEVTATLRDLGAEYVVVSAGPADGMPARLRAREVSMRQWAVPVQWSPWYLDGRSAVCGWRAGPGSEKPSFAAMALDPVSLAFGPDVEKLPARAVSPVREQGRWEEAFVWSPRVPPPDADEALAWRRYKQARADFAVQVRDRAWDQLHVLGSALAGGWPAVVAERAADVIGGAVRQAASRGVFVPPAPDDEGFATPVLSLRAAYRAIAADPDGADGYIALAYALGDPQLPLDEAVRTVGQITALRQALARIPPPEDYRPGSTIATPSQLAYDLAGLYLGRRPELGPTPVGIPVNHLAFRVLSQPRGTGFLPAAAVIGPDRQGRMMRQWVGSTTGVIPQNAPLYLLPLDEAREMLLLTRKYVLADPPRNAEELDRAMQQLEKELKSLEDELGRMRRRYEQKSSGQAKLSAQVEAALELNLVGEALRLLRDEKTDLEKEFGRSLPQVILSRVALELAVGRLEDAAADLDALTATPAWQPLLANDDTRPLVQMLRHHRFMMEGNYAEAGKILEVLETEFSRQDPLKEQRQQFDPKLFVESKQSLVDWVNYSPLMVIRAPTPMDATARLLWPTITLHGYGMKSGFLDLQNSLGTLRQAEGNFYLRRGMLSLFEGDIKAARQRFVQTRSTPEQAAEDKKWGLPERRYSDAERYIRLIDKAAERARPK